MTDKRLEADSAGSADEKLAQDALRRLQTPRISEEARQVALQAFLTGENYSTVQASGSPRTSLEAASGRGLKQSPMLWLWPTIGAAALLAIYLFGSQPNESWRVTRVVNSAGITMPAGTATADKAPGQGMIQLSPGSELDLKLGDQLSLVLLPGTELQLPKGPGRWFDRDRIIRLTSGEAFGASAGPLGYKLTLETPEATATLVGTSFAVIRRPDATCFCLYRGHLDIRVTANGSAIELPEESRVVIPRDGSASHVEPIQAGERMKLEMIEAAATSIPDSPE